LIEVVVVVLVVVVVGSGHRVTTRDELADSGPIGQS
jgi:hypothetical protein